MVGERFLFLLLLLLAIGLPSCDSLVSEVDLPVYLESREPTVLVKPFQNDNFTTNAGVRDLWFFSGSRHMGVYKIPSVVPVYPEAGRELLVAGGIFESGLSASRLPYPFWRSETMPVTAGPLDTQNVVVTFSYFSDTALVYPFIEDFEDASLQLINTAEGPKKTELRWYTGDSFRGSGSGRVIFGNGKEIFEVITKQFLRIPQSTTRDSYAEIVFKGSMPFTSGVFYVSASGQAGEIPSGVFYRPDSEWNTVYVHLNILATLAPPNSIFKFFIRTNSGELTGDLLLDDVRIVQFK